MSIGRSLPACIGIDAGYGWTKWSANNKSDRFPSIWAPYQSGSEGWGISHAVPIIVNDMAPAVTGHQCVGSTQIRHPFQDSRLTNPDILPILATAIWEAGVEGDIILGTGTPLETFSSEVDNSTQALTNLILQIRCGHETRSVRIVKACLRPQGVAAAIWLLWERRIAQQRAADLYLVIDIGNRTTDVLTLRMDNGQPIPNLSFSSSIAIATAATRFQKTLSQKTGTPIPLDEAQKALEEPVFWNGHNIGGPDAASPFLDNLAEALKDEIRQHLGSFLPRVSGFVTVGGGAALLGRRLDNVSNGTRTHLSVEESIFANTYGYQRTAEREATRNGTR